MSRGQILLLVALGGQGSSSESPTKLKSDGNEEHVRVLQDQKHYFEQK